MKTIKLFIFITISNCFYRSTFSQTTDSLSVFPNPFRNSTTIHFDIVQSDTITLRVFNTVGQIVKTYFQSTILPSGSYNINLPMKKFDYDNDSCRMVRTLSGQLELKVMDFQPTKA